MEVDFFFSFFFLFLVGAACTHETREFFLFRFVFLR